MRSAEGTRARPVRDGLTVGLVVGLSGTAFGIAGTAGKLSLWQTCAMSLFVFTGASQFALVGALAAGAGPLAAVPGALLLGVRNAFYGLRLAERLELRALLRPAAAHWIVDETTAVTLGQPDRRSARIAFVTTGLSLFTVWNLSTLAGALGATALGDPGRYGLDAAGPAVFLALLAPRLRRGPDGVPHTERVVAVLGAALAVAATPVLPTGVPVLLAVAVVPIALIFRGTR
jgi:predicted branched-subunit amino acid permease